MRSPCGNPEAQKALGNAYIHRAESEADVQKGVAWLEKSAKAGNEDAMIDLADMYSGGFGLRRNSLAMWEWLYRAATLGNADAKARLANVTNEPFDGKRADALIDAGKGAEAQAYAEPYAVAGDPAAQNTLGLAYTLGSGVAADVQKGVAWLEKSAEGGNEDSMLSLVSLYGGGFGVPADPVAARKWLERAAALGNAEAKSLLAAAPGAGAASGGGLDENRLLELVQAGKGKEIMNYLAPFVKAEHPRAMRYAGGTLSGGKFGVPADAQGGVALLKKAALAGDTDACGEVGAYYYSGRTIKPDLREAAKWFAMGAEKNDPLSLYACASLIVDENVTELGDMAQALDYFARAAALGMGDAHYALGLHYEYGEGVAEDLARARRHYVSAVDLGYEKAAERLASLDAELSSVDAGALSTAYAKNPAQAGREYTGKTLRVSGVVVEAGRTASGAPYAALAAGPGSAAAVRCLFESADAHIVDSFGRGQKVRLGGRCGGAVSGVPVLPTCFVPGAR